MYVCTYNVLYVEQHIKTQPTAPIAKTKNL